MYTRRQIFSDELPAAAELLMKALMVRAQYMVSSRQRFPRVGARCLRMLIDEEFLPALIDDRLLDELLGSRAAAAATQGSPPHHLDYISRES